MLLRQHNLRDGTPVNGERLEELRARSHRLRMLHDHSYRTAAGPISDLYPVPTHASERTEHDSKIRKYLQLMKKRLQIEHVLVLGVRYTDSAVMASFEGS